MNFIGTIYSEGNILQVMKDSTDDPAMILLALSRTAIRNFDDLPDLTIGVDIDGIVFPPMSIPEKLRQQIGVSTPNFTHAQWLELVDVVDQLSKVEQLIRATGKTDRGQEFVTVFGALDQTWNLRLVDDTTTDAVATDATLHMLWLMSEELKRKILALVPRPGRDEAMYVIGGREVKFSGNRIYFVKEM